MTQDFIEKKCWRHDHLAVSVNYTAPWSIKLLTVKKFKKLGAMNLSKKKINLKFKGLQFWFSTASSFLSAASKQPLKLTLLKTAH